MYNGKNTGVAGVMSSKDGIDVVERKRTFHSLQTTAFQ